MKSGKFQTSRFAYSGKSCVLKNQNLKRVLDILATRAKLSSMSTFASCHTIRGIAS